MNEENVIRDLAQKMKEFIDECIIQKLTLGRELTPEEVDKIYEEKVGVTYLDYETVI